MSRTKGNTKGSPPQRVGRFLLAPLDEAVPACFNCGASCNKRAWVGVAGRGAYELRMFERHDGNFVMVLRSQDKEVRRVSDYREQVFASAEGKRSIESVRRAVVGLLKRQRAIAEDKIKRCEAAMRALSPPAKRSAR